MSRRFSAMAAACCLTVSIPVGADEVAMNGRQFTVPAGFELQMVAGPPLVERPISAAFDELGRLYVTESSGSNDRVQVQLEQRPHRILRLEDTDGDGTMDARVVFADKMMFPEGAMWHDGSLYVAAPPDIWKLTDTDDDGRADRRERWFEGRTLTGCANDLHGPYLGRDGWIYWCKGAFAEQTYERPGRAPWVTRASHIFRRRPQGGVVEPVMTGGMDNPVEVVFTPGGERIFNTTFLQHPAGGKRDGLIHAIYGGVYGKPHGVLDGHPRTGDLMPPLVHLGAAAPSGLALLESRRLGDDYRGSVVASLFNMHRVTRHVLVPHDATFSTVDHDLLVSTDLDFHPTDVLEDADGSIVVVDTGGWYKLCCPTSQLWKPDVLGAIYRLVPTRAPAIVDARGNAIRWQQLSAEQLMARLSDDRPAVVERARHYLRKRGALAVDALTSALTTSGSSAVRREAVWTLCGIDDSTARAASRAAINDSNEQVRQAAMHAASVWRDGEATPLIVDQLRSASPHNRRVAAEALGRVGDATVVRKLLEATPGAHDRVLQHSLIYALIELDAADRVRGALVEDAPASTVSAALMALDQMPSGKLSAAEVFTHLRSSDRRLSATAWWIADQRRSWSDQLVPYIEEQFAASLADPGDMAAVFGRLRQFAGAAAIQQFIAERIESEQTPPVVRLALLEVMAGSGLRAIPRSWNRPLSTLLSADDPSIVGRVVRAYRALAPKGAPADVAPTLMAVSGSDRFSIEIRLAAAAAAAVPQVAPDTFQMLANRLAGDAPVDQRAAALDVLSAARLSEPQRRALAERMPDVNPLDAGRLFSIVAQVESNDADGDGDVLSALERSSSLAAINPEELKTWLSKLKSPPLAARAGALAARVDALSQDKQQRMAEVFDLLPQADERRGQAIFQGTKASCSACHALGYLGGTIGPDLTRIGRIRTEQDLLESIMFPSESFVRSYESVVLGTFDGRVLAGIIRDETATEIVLAIDATRQQRIPTADVELRKEGTVSIMPAGLDQHLTPQDLADLVKFLKNAQ